MFKPITFVLKCLGIVLVFVLLCDICLERYKLSSCNQAPLEIKTFDGTNSPYHPSVRFYSKGWNNYKYWMAETPFYPYGQPYRDRNECPCIHVSNDGIHWTEIVNNPIDDLDSLEIKNLDYFSDPHLVQQGDTLECWYRITKRHGDVDNRGNVLLFRKRSVDGVHWSDRDTLFDFTPLQKDEFVSPAILHPDSTYDMWYVDDYKIYFMQTCNPKEWDAPMLCKLNGADCKPWHIDVVELDGVFWLLCYDMINNRMTLWKSSDKKSFDFVKVILEPSLACGSFYQNMLYRACLLKQSDDCYRIYFSANNLEMTFIGLMEGPSFEDVQIVDVDNSGYSNFSQFIKYYFLSRWRSFSYRIKHFSDD